MGHMTAEQPKCMTRLAGRTLLEWQVAALQAAGINEIGIVRGYRKELLPDSLYHFDNLRWAETNMVASLACAGQWLESGPCIVSYSDIVYSPNTISSLMSSSDDIAISYNTEWRPLWEARFDDPLADAETFEIDPSGKISDIGHRPHSMDEIQGQYMGLLKFEKFGWNQVAKYLSSLTSQEIDRLDMTSLLQHLISNGIPIHGVPVSGMWYEVDTESDWALCEKEISECSNDHWLLSNLGDTRIEI